MYCTKCGHLLDTGLYCLVCGAQYELREIDYTLETSTGLINPYSNLLGTIILKGNKIVYSNEVPVVPVYEYIQWEY